MQFSGVSERTWLFARAVCALVLFNAVYGCRKSSFQEKKQNKARTSHSPSFKKGQWHLVQRQRTASPLVVLLEQITETDSQYSWTSVPELPDNTGSRGRACSGSRDPRKHEGCGSTSGPQVQRDPRGLLVGRGDDPRHPHPGGF